MPAHSITQTITKNEINSVGMAATAIPEDWLSCIIAVLLGVLPNVSVATGVAEPEAVITQQDPMPITITNATNNSAMRFATIISSRMQDRRIGNIFPDLPLSGDKDECGYP